MQDQEKQDYERSLETISDAVRYGATFLTLANRRITNLPPEIGGLVTLESLHLSSNQLTNLPPEIGNLVQLKNLRINNNKLTNLPPEIGNLIRLESINLSSNHLTNLPPEIGNLVRLKDLYINNNKLTILPNRLANLSNLDELNVAQNQLIEIPSQVRTSGLKLMDGANVLKTLVVGGRWWVGSEYSQLPDEAQIIINQWRNLPSGEPDTPEQNEPEVILLDFEVLPQGFYDMPQYQEIPNNKSERDRHVPQIDRGRLRFVENLGPNQAYRGSSQFGPDVYHVFVFSNCVVAECPTEGNAIYVLKGVDNWKTLLSIPKLELRQDYANRVQRIMHRGDWKDRLRKAVR